MSPQSRATTNESTTSSSRDNGSGNLCSAVSSVAEIARAADMEYSLHKIESESSATAAILLEHQTHDSGVSALSRKRSSTRISSSPKSQPFLSSYGSAFLSGIFADIADVSDDQPQHGSADAQCGGVPAETADNGSSEPCHKKARSSASTSFGRQPKSNMALAGLAEGAHEVSSPSVVSPRVNTSATLNFPNFNDQVRELQDMAFPSLPQIPISVSSSSCSAVSSQALAPFPPAIGGEPQEEQDSPSYGWFVSTDEDETVTPAQLEPSSSPSFLGIQPDLAFKAVTVPEAGNQDIIVQQALAADTIDDVLGDLF